MKRQIIRYYFTPVIGAAALLVISGTLAYALSPVEIEELAKTATVQINSVIIGSSDPGPGFGSGVIIKRKSNTYTVLTSKSALSWGIFSLVLPDGKVVEVNQETAKVFPKLDAVLFSFNSSNSYSVATLGDSSQLRKGQPCYLYGFSKNGTQFSEGTVSVNLYQPVKDGLSFACSNQILPGMSGGPMFDQQGHLIVSVPIYSPWFLKRSCLA